MILFPILFFTVALAAVQPDIKNKPLLINASPFLEFKLFPGQFMWVRYPESQALFEQIESGLRVTLISFIIFRLC